MESYGTTENKMAELVTEDIKREPAINSTGQTGKKEDIRCHSFTHM
jgi:hypothetical protein